MDLAEVKALLGITVDTFDDQITSLLPTVIDGVAQETNRDLSEGVPEGLKLIIASDILGYLLGTADLGDPSITSKSLGDFSVSYSFDNSKHLTADQRSRKIKPWIKLRFV